jgi:hypothetical protein
VYSWELLFWNSPGKAKENHEGSQIRKFVTQKTAMLLNTNQVYYESLDLARHHHQHTLFFYAKDGDSSSQTVTKLPFYNRTEKCNL